jgi:penicillin amidase
MMARPVRLTVAALALPLAVLAGAVRLDPVPPLGTFLDPYHGIWSATMTARLPPFTLFKKTRGLDSAVRVLYDARAVPHIFARTEHDAYYALGLVVARDRLVQLELQARAGSGRLTELAGPAALPLDRETRALGLPRAARRAFAAVDTTSAAAHAIRAYADGVNAWLDHLEPDELPLEYHLLGRRPERWEPINTLHLLNRMSYTLAMDSFEFERAAAAARVGAAAADALFPAHSPLQEPIVPNGHTAPYLIATRLPPPGIPDTAALAVAEATPHGAGVGAAADPERDVGSNNWAVAPRRTAHGAALLAGDPHLDLTLPSIWYEVHLVVPGHLDVYGVTLPGAPAVVIGFNRDVAWTSTNTTSDVLDYYAETVDDVAHPTRYRVDGAWRPIETEVERYRGIRGEIIATDTLRYTHRGPLRRIRGRWLSMRWTALEPSDDVAAYAAASHARTTGEWLAGMAPFFVPAQNMLVADRAGTIAIRSTGHFPIRPGDGRGDYVRDGASSANDWLGYRPITAYPTSIDPAQGFLASANQEPQDPSASSGYLGSNWPAPWRAIRIDALLRADSAVTPDDMRRFQTDPGSARAEYFLPYFAHAAARGDAGSRAQEAARLLAQWDGRYTVDNTRAVLFEQALHELTLRAWEPLRGADGQLVATPSSAVLAELLADSTSVWWHHGRDAVITQSLAAALDSVTTRFGPPDGGGWRWDHIKTVNIEHLLPIPAFSRFNLSAPGGPMTLSPVSGNGHEGPSWRMVVELGPTIHAWSIYPGGQSGNPLSRRYADRLPRWLAGRLDNVVVPHTPSELGGGARSILELDPDSGRGR